MTVENQQCFVSYDEDGGEDTFPTTFKFLEAAHLVVKLTIGDTTSTLTLDVDYTVSGAGAAEPGGEVVLLAPPDHEAFTLTILRQTPVIQPIAFQASGPFVAAVVERQADRLVLIEQENQRRLEVLEAGEVVAPAPGGGASVIITKTFTTADPVEDTFPLSVAIASGMVAVSVQSSRTENLDDGAAVFLEPPAVDWAPATDAVSLKHVSGLEPGVSYRNTLEVLVTESDSLEPIVINSPDTIATFEVTANTDTLPSTAAILFISAASQFDLSSDPSIEPGTVLGQRLTVLFDQDSPGSVNISGDNTVLLVLDDHFLLQSNLGIAFMWDGTYWLELNRNTQSAVGPQQFGPGTVVAIDPLAGTTFDSLGGNGTGANTADIQLTTADVLMTAVPTLPTDLGEGREITFINRGGTYKLTFQDEGTLPGSALKLSTNTFDLINGNSIRLRFMSGTWYEVARAILV